MPRQLILTRAFAEDQAALDAYNQRQLGQREVAIAAIVGTVGRLGLRDTRRAKNWAKTWRYRALRAALEEGANLPPIDLYLLAGSYYILDGHHRVAVARDLGALEVDAIVTEFVPRAEPAADWHRQHVAFERDTGLAGIPVRQPEGYARLRCQLAAHRCKLAAQRCTPPSLAATAADWARTVYRPAVAQLISRGLPEREPDLTATELFLAFQDFATDWGVVLECEGGMTSAVATYARLHRMPWLAWFAGWGVGGHRVREQAMCDFCAAL
jgi:ParB/Sulfiredoxin domain